MSSSSHWQQWVIVEPEADVFERTIHQIAEEERKLRIATESQLYEYKRLVMELVGIILADELDRRLRADPTFIERATPATWRALVQSRRTNGRQPAGEVQGLQEQIVKLREQTARLQAENQALQRQIASEQMLRNLAQAPEGPAARPSLPPANEAVQPWTPSSPADVRWSGLSDINPINMPSTPPARIAQLFTNWPRQSLALAAVGITGWSMRRAINDLLSVWLGVQMNAGSMRRLFETLAERELWYEQKVILPGVQEAKSGPGATLILVRLAPQGETALQACGVATVPSEWDLLRAAEGDVPVRHGLACAFAYHARLRGWATAISPPAVLVRQGDEVLPTAIVTDEAPDPRWLAQHARQGRLALVALNAELRQKAVSVARAGGFYHGLATDLQTLLATQASRGPLWTEQW